MQELSMNVLDVAENSVQAGAKHIEISLRQDTASGFQTLQIQDDGCGMSAELARGAADPFYTTRTTRPVGLGIPFLKQAAEMAGGSFALESEEGAGTRVTATFMMGHIDLMPLGDMPGTVSALVQTSPDIDFVFCFERDDASFAFDTRDARAILGDVPLSEPAVAVFVKNHIDEGMQSVLHAGHGAAEN